MSIELPLALAADAAELGVESKFGARAWVEAAATILFAATAVLFVSFIAVMTGLV